MLKRVTSLFLSIIMTCSLIIQSVPTMIWAEEYYNLQEEDNSADATNDGFSQEQVFSQSQDLQDSMIDIEFLFADDKIGFSEKERPIETGKEVDLKITLNPKYTNGYAQNVKVHINLPFLTFDEEGNTIQTLVSDYMNNGLMILPEEESAETDVLDEEEADAKTDGEEEADETDTESGSADEDEQSGQEPDSIANESEDEDMDSMSDDEGELSIMAMGSDNEDATIGDDEQVPAEESEPEMNQEDSAFNELEEDQNSDALEESDQDDTEDDTEDEADADTDAELADEDLVPAADIDLQAYMAMLLNGQENGVAVTAIGADDGWIIPEYGPDYKGELVIERLTLQSGTAPSFYVSLVFYGPDLIENAVANVTGWVEYDGFAGEEKHWETPERYSSDADVLVVNSNLTWDAKLKTLREKTTIWDRFNYVPFEFTIENTSTNDTSMIDRFNINMAVPYVEEEFIKYGYIGGMTDLDAYLWKYADGMPVYNQLLEKLDGIPYVGNPALQAGHLPSKGLGGILIYDITDVTEPIPNDVFPDLQPLPYTYTGAAQLTVHFTGQAKKLYPAGLVGGENKGKRTFRIYVPFDNRFIKGKLDHTFNMKFQPTVSIGDKDRYIRWTKDRNSSFTLVKPDHKGMTVKKTAQTEEAFFMSEGYYSISDIKNNANAPYFDPYVIDILPKDFDFKGIRYTVPWGGTGQPNITDYLSIGDEIFQYEIYTKDRQGNENTQWYTFSSNAAIETEQKDGTFTWTFGRGTDIEETIGSLKQQLGYNEYNGVEVDFTRRIKVQFKNRVESGETIQGTLFVAGVYQIGGIVTNDALLYYDFKQHMAPEQYLPEDENPAYVPVYATTPEGPARVSADVDVKRPGPVLTIKAYRGDTGELGDNLPVPYDAPGERTGSGFHYYIGNTTGAPMAEAQLSIRLPVYQPRLQMKVKNGLMSDELVISKKLLDSGAKIEKITLIQEEPGLDPIAVVITAAELNGNLTSGGSIVIGLPYTPNQVLVDFSYFPANINDSMDSKNYIALYGSTTRYGTLPATATWQCVLPDTTLSQSKQNTLEVIKPDPQIRAYAEFAQYSNTYKTQNNTLSDKELGWTLIPYGRLGAYVFHLYNPSESCLQQDSQITVDFTIAGSGGEKNRGYRLQDMTIPKALLDVMEIDTIELTDTDMNKTIIQKINNDFFVMAGGSPGSAPLLDGSSNLIVTKADVSNLANTKSMILNIKYFKEGITNSLNYAIITHGYLDEIPFKYGDANRYRPSAPVNVVSGVWDSIINEDEHITSRDKAGFTNMAAMIDYNLYAKIGGTTGYTNKTTLFDEYGYYPTSYENMYMDTGYKSIGSFVSGITQPQDRYESNVKMTLDIEYKLPYQDFELYYIKLNPALKAVDPDIGVKVYRLADDGTEELWFDNNALGWVDNANNLTGQASDWFRINTLWKENLAKGEMFTTKAVTNDMANRLTESEEERHPYYRSPRLDVDLKNQVTRVVLTIEINQDAVDGTGKAKMPDLNTADDLIHLTGRFYKTVGSTYAESTITYTFGEGDSLRNMTPNDPLIGSIRTIKSMLNHFRQDAAYGNGNHWGTSYTRAYFMLHEPVAEVRKGVQDNIARKVPQATTTNPSTSTTFAVGNEPLYGDMTGFLLGFWNGVDTMNTVDRDTLNDWYGKKVFADQVYLADTLPSVSLVYGEDESCEGFIVSKIEYGSTQAVYQEDFDSIVVELTNQTMVFTKADFGNGPIRINFHYPFMATAAGEPGIDVTLPENVFLKGYQVIVNKLNGHGDASSEFNGVAAESNYQNGYVASLDVDGRILSTDYEINQILTQVYSTSNGRKLSSKSIIDYARIRGLAAELLANLKISSNITGENQFVYNPRKLEIPNKMEYYYDFDNPARTGIAPKAPVGRLDVFIPRLDNFRMEDMEIPEELFNGDVWECTAFTIGGIDVLNHFKKDNGLYKLHIRDLGWETVDAEGYAIRDRGPGDDGKVSIQATFKVRDMTDKTTYLAEGETIKDNTEHKKDHDIVIRGVYAETLESKGEEIWDSDSRTTIDKKVWAYSRIFTADDTNTAVTAYSNSKYSNPKQTKVSFHSYVHEVKNLVADIDFTEVSEPVYDTHGNQVMIADTDIMPGDRVKVRLTMENTGNPDDYGDGFTYLNQPLMRYYVPKGVRILNWKYAEDDTDIPVSAGACKNVTNPSAVVTLNSGDDLSSVAPYVKDLAWEFNEKLDEGQKIVIDLELEYTDELGFGTAYPQMYQNALINAAKGTLIASGGKTHGFIPFLYGVRSQNSILQTEIVSGSYTRGQVNADPSNAALQNITGATYTMKTDKMVDTAPLTVEITPAQTYKGKPENISGQLVNILVGNIANHTRHEETGLKVEVILDLAEKLKGIQLVEWPELSYPAGFTGEFPAPKLYYKLTDQSQLWIEVLNLSDPVPADDVYAIMWDYGKLPAHGGDNANFVLDDVMICGQAFWRSSNPENDDSSYYEPILRANTYFTHNEHGYEDRVIGKTTDTVFRVYKEQPFVQLDSQVFAREEEAKKPYQESNQNRIQTYRPGEELWYKITLKNQSRDTIYTDVGTGPLIAPVIFDKVPEYVHMFINPSGISAGELDINQAIASGDLHILWYDAEGNLKPGQPEVTVTVTEIRDKDIGGAQEIYNYKTLSPLVNASVLSAERAREITYRVYQYNFSENLERDERIEIQYRAKSRTENLPTMFTLENGAPTALYLPRMGEYADYRSGSLRAVYPEYNKTTHLNNSGLNNSVMDGDYLIHEVGVSGIPNMGTPLKSFLNHSLVWIPGFDSNVGDTLIFNQVNGHNGDLFDYDLRTSLIQKAEVRMNQSGQMDYVNTKYQTNRTDKSRDIWTLILKPRIAGFMEKMGAEYNIVWTQDRLHLSRAWLYSASQMIPDDTNDHYELDKYTYKEGTVQDYVNDNYTFGTERGETFTARQWAVNYGDYHLDGVEFIYVLPRGTEPVMKDGKIDITAYYGEPYLEKKAGESGLASTNAASKGKTEFISAVSYEILQQPEGEDTPSFLAPKGLMEGKSVNTSSYYTDSSEASKPWVIKITVNAPLTAWWNSNNAKEKVSSGVKGYYLTTEFKVRVLEENANGNWFDEVYASALDDTTEQYMQIYDMGYTIGSAANTTNVTDAGYKAMDMLASDYAHGIYYEYYWQNKVGFSTAQTPYVRGKNVQTTRTTKTKSGFPLTDVDGVIDTNFDGVSEEKLFAHNGDVLAAKKPMIRLWTDIGTAKTADFFQETQSLPFNLNIHVYNQYEWAKRPRPTLSGELYQHNERFYHNHQTDGGLQGTYFEPIISNILPYGIVPVDTDGNALPVNGIGWVAGGSRRIDFEVTGTPYTKEDWVATAEFLETDESGNPLNRYKVTLKPKDYDTFEEEVKIRYNEHMVITLKVKTDAWPENTYEDPFSLTVKQDLDMNSRWQLNRTYAATKKDIFFFLIEPAASPYIVGSSRRPLVTDDRPDVQGTDDKIKAMVLGKIAIGQEKDTINAEDYSSRTPLILSLPQKDFNRNGNSITSVEGGTVVLQDTYVSNSMIIYTKHPRLVIDKSVARKADANKDEDPLSVSYGNTFWYNLKVKNAPVPITDPKSINNLQRHEATKGTLQSADIHFNDWIPSYVTFEDYLIQYPSVLAAGGTETKTPAQLAGDGWNVSFGPQKINPSFLDFHVQTNEGFMNRPAWQQNQGDLRTGEEFTLKLGVRVTDVGVLDDEPDVPWGKFENRVYVNADSITQPDYFNEYVTLAKEKDKSIDYNLNGTAVDEFGTDNAYINIKKPKGSIRQDTKETRKLFESGAIDNPIFGSTQQFTFMLDELKLPNADVPELIIEVHGLSERKYKEKTQTNLWEITLRGITTGVWTVPEEYNPDDYRIYVYYSKKIQSFEELGDASKWILLNPGGTGLSENASLSGAVAGISDTTDITNIIYVIRSQHPDKNPVPAGIRIDVDADNAKSGKQDVSEVDPNKRNVDGYTNSVYTNSPQITYEPMMYDGISHQLYSNVALWARYSKTGVTMLNKDTAGVHITPSNPVLDIVNSVSYFRFNSANKSFKWNDNIVVNAANSKTIKYTIQYTNVEEKRSQKIQYPEDLLINPVIVDALPHIVHVSKDNFVMAEGAEQAIFEDDYQSSADIKDNAPKWYWEVVPGADRNPAAPPSNITLDKVEVNVPINKKSSYDPEESFSRNIIRWKFKGILQPGDTIVVKFIATVDNLSADQDQYSSVNDVYGYNENGTMVVFIDPALSSEEHAAAIDIDEYDLNGNNKMDDRFVTNYAKKIGFVTFQDFIKTKRVYSDLNNTGKSTVTMIPAAEGSVYSFETSVVNPMEEHEVFKNPVILDILPYEGDQNILGNKNNQTGLYTGINRKSQWRGWLLPETIQLYEKGDSKTLIPAGEYEVLVGPFTEDERGNLIAVPEKLPALDERSVAQYYKQLSGMADPAGKEAFRRGQNFIPLSRLMALKKTDFERYEELRKSILVLYVQVLDKGGKQYTLSGQSSLNLRYDMEMPLNLQATDKTEDANSAAGTWNSFVSWTASQSLPGESNKAGVYIQKPEGRAYLGDYVWLDKNGNGIQDENATETGPNGRSLSKINGEEDAGINGVTVELLSVEGYPVDSNGNRVKAGTMTRTVNGKTVTKDVYYVIDEKGIVKKDTVERDLLGGTPVSFTTTSDSEGRKGYYILSNIAPGEYQLKFTFPEEYKYYGITTPYTHQDVKVTGEGPDTGEGKLTVMTDPFTMEAGWEDTCYTDFDLGVRMPVRYGGMVWLDENAVDISKSKNGFIDLPDEIRLQDVPVYLYTKDGKPAVDMLNRPAETTTDQNGAFRFDYLKPDTEYYVQVKQSTDINGYASPAVPNENMLEFGDDNDLFHMDDGTNRTNMFKAVIPEENGVPVYTDSTKKQYASVDTIGLSFIDINQNMITGILWDDIDKDGLRSSDEPLMEGVTVWLKRYVMVNGLWEEDTGFVEKSSKTNRTGVYFFDRLEKKSEEDRQYGYIAYMKAMPDGYTVTKYQVASGTSVSEAWSLFESDLQSNGYFVKEQVVFAALTGGEWMQIGETIRRFDGGLTLFAQGSVKGKAMAVYDKAKIEQPIQGLVMRLEVKNQEDGTFYPVICRKDGTMEPQILTYDMEGYANQADLHYTVTTDVNGNYVFEQLPIANAITRIPYEYRVITEKPAFAKWQEGKGNTFTVISGDEEMGTSAVIGLASEDIQDMYQYNLLYAKTSTGNDLYLGYPAPVSITGNIWLHDANKAVQKPNSQALKNRKVFLYCYDSEANEWQPDTDLMGNHEAVTNGAGYYQFVVAAGEMDIRKTSTLMEQKQYRVVFAKEPNESFMPDSDIQSVSSDDSLTEETMYQLGVDLLTGGISKTMVFGETTIGIPYGGREIVDLDTVEAVVNADCIVSRAVHGKITGFVWLDKNANGIQDKSETGASGSKVYLYRWDGTKWQLHKDVNGRSSLAIGNNGQYEFLVDAAVYTNGSDVLALQKYRVVFEKDKNQSFTSPDQEGANSKAITLSQWEGQAEELAGLGLDNVNRSVYREAIVVADTCFDPYLNREVIDFDTIGAVRKVDCGIIPSKKKEIISIFGSISSGTDLAAQEEFAEDAVQAEETDEMTGNNQSKETDTPEDGRQSGNTVWKAPEGFIPMPGTTGEISEDSAALMKEAKEVLPEDFVHILREINGLHALDYEGNGDIFTGNSTASNGSDVSALDKKGNAELNSNGTGVPQLKNKDTGKSSEEMEDDASKANKDSIAKGVMAAVCTMMAGGGLWFGFLKQRIFRIRIFKFFK